MLFRIAAAALLLAVFAPKQVAEVLGVAQQRQQAITAEARRQAEDQLLARLPPGLRERCRANRTECRALLERMARGEAPPRP